MNELNDIAKRSAAERLVKAMQLEKIGPSEVARFLNILPQYVTMAKQEKYWPKMPRSAWDRILLWCNSGETLHHFKIPNGEIKKEESKPKIELPPKEIARRPVEKQEFKGIYSYLADQKPNIKPKAEIEVIPPGPECIEEMDAVKIKIIIDMQIYINGKEIKF